MTELYLDHLLFTDLAIPVDVVKVEAPQNLLFWRALGNNGEKIHEISESYPARLFPVNCSEDQVGILGGVPKREDLGVHLLECVLVDDPIGALLLERPVQEFHLLPCELCLLSHLIYL